MSLMPSDAPGGAPDDVTPNVDESTDESLRDLPWETDPADAVEQSIEVGYDDGHDHL
jgi:hypothetical protein